MLKCIKRFCGMYKVFVSSTYLDLKEYRESVRQILREMKFEDVAMEYFTAEDQRPVDKCLSEVASCDLYIGIFAWRYGHIPPGETKSITELEYRKAVATGKECLIFLVDTKKPWIPEYIDKGENYSKLESLKIELSNKHVKHPFNSPQDLASSISSSVHNWEAKKNSTTQKKEFKLNISNYSQIIYNKYCTLDLDTLTPSTSELNPRVQLKNIFVEQNVRESLPPMELPKEVCEKIQEEWKLDKECFPEGLDFYDIKKETELYYSKMPSPVLDVITNEGNKSLVILGDPGSGKSTLSRYILLSILGHNPDPKINKKFSNYLPLLIELRDFVSLCSKKDCRNFLDYYQYIGDMQGYEFTREEIDDYLINDGRALIIFDGLDEIFDPIEWTRVNEMIVGFNILYPKVKIIITSRIIGYNRKMFLDAGFKHFTLQDFDEDHISKFLDKWYPIAMYDNQEESKKRKERIVKTLKESNSIRQLAGNPLLLTILAIIGRHQELPKERWELYNHAAGVLVQRWDVDRNLKNNLTDAEYIDEKDKKELLRRIAFKMQSGPDGLAGNFIHLDKLHEIIEEYLIERFRVNHGKAKVIAKYIIDQLRKRNFILCLYGADFFGFIHRTFLEYFCSSAIVEKFNDQDINIDNLKEQFYSKYWENKTWHEVLRLICGMKEKIAGDLIEHLINVYHPKDYGNRPPWNIVLAIKCLSEVRNLESIDEPSKKLLRNIFELFKIASHDSNMLPFLAEEIVPSAKILGTNWPNRDLLVDWISGSTSSILLYRSQYINGLLSNLWADFIANVGLDSENIYLAIEKKLYCDNKSKCLAILVLGKFRSKRETVRTLLINSTSNNEDREVRVNAVEALAMNWNSDPEILELIKGYARNDKDIEVRNSAVKSLAMNWNSDPEILELTKEYAQNDKDSTIRSSAVKLLAMNWNSDPEILELIKEYAQNDKDSTIRSSAIEALAMKWNSDPEILELIKEYSRNDKNIEIRSSAIQTLASNWRNNTEILELIKEYAKNDRDSGVRSNAIQTLAFNYRNNPEILGLIKEYVKNSEDQLGNLFLISIMSTNDSIDSEIQELIKDFLSSKEIVIRIVTMSLLVKINSNPEIQEIIKEYAQNDKDSKVRSTAVEVLASGCNSDPEILGLIKEYAKNDKDSRIRSNAVKTLAVNWRDNPEILELIKEYAKNDKDSRVRSNAVEALAKNWNSDPEILELIKEYAKNDKDSRVRSNAVEALAVNWRNNPEILGLIKEYAINDKDGTVRSSAVDALAKNWNSDPEILELIKEYAKNDKNSRVRSSAVEALAKNWNSDPEILGLIKEYAKNDKDGTVRSSAVDALAKNWNSDLEILGLIKEYAQKDKDIEVRNNAVKTLAIYWNSDPEILELIKEYAKNDKNSRVRSSAVEALAKNWNSDPEILELIKEYAKNDKDGTVRSSAVDALAKNWNSDLEILGLIKEYAQKDKDIEVRNNAVKTLAIYWNSDPEILELIKEYAKNDKNSRVRSSAVEALAKNWNSDPEILELIKE